MADGAVQGDIVDVRHMITILVILAIPTVVFLLLLAVYTVFVRLV